ncbi:MAG TPA: hypothetical protein VHF22_06990, partial [Planctomycetota bacterium]|nr:hypothetical protein [Planctomycetota bacterium]
HAELATRRGARCDDAIARAELALGDRAAARATIEAALADAGTPLEVASPCAALAAELRARQP